MKTHPIFRIVAKSNVEVGPSPPDAVAGVVDEVVTRKSVEGNSVSLFFSPPKGHFVPESQPLVTNQTQTGTANEDQGPSPPAVATGGSVVTLPRTLGILPSPPKDVRVLEASGPTRLNHRK